MTPKETMITPLECSPPWSLGCLYQCQICKVKFQTETSFRSHLFFHSLSEQEYREQQGEAGLRITHHSCLVCGEMVQCDPHYLSSHLATHGLSLNTYSDLHCMGEDQEIVSTISSTSKSSPCLLDTSRKSLELEEEEVEEVDEEDSDYEMMEMPEPHVEIEEPDSELLALETEEQGEQGEQEERGELVENMFRSSDWADRCVYQCRQVLLINNPIVDHI